LGDLGFLFTFRSLFFLTLAAIRRKAANQKDLLPLKFNLPAFSLSATIDWILNYSTVNDTDNTDAGTSAGDIDYRLLQCSTSRPARECDWKAAESTKFSG
jgi:hypothetical protein